MKTQEDLKKLKFFLFNKILLRKLHSITLDRIVNGTSGFPISEFEDPKIQLIISKEIFSDLEKIKEFCSYSLVCDYFDEFNDLINNNELTVDGAFNIFFSNLSLLEAKQAHRKSLTPEVKKTDNVFA